MAEFYIKQGSTTPSAVRTLPEGVDLEGKTVEFRMTTSTFRPVLKRQAVVESVEERRVRMDWRPGDTKDHGTMLAEWAVKGPGNLVDVFPVKDYDTIHIIRNLDQ